MKTSLLSAIIVLAAGAAFADTTVKISDVHLCCHSCVKGVETAVAPVKGVTVAADQDASTVTLTGPDTATVQKAADAIVNAGYYGTSSNPDVKVSCSTGAKGEKVQTLTVTGVHLCCGKCVKSVNEALSKVPGVTGNTATKGAKSFTVTGDFKDSDVFDALQKDGLCGREGK